jgi:hypothetical protein
LSNKAKEICNLKGFEEASAEEVYDAVPARILKLDKDVEAARQRRMETVTGGGAQPALPGPEEAADANGAAGGPRPSTATTAGSQGPPEEPGGLPGGSAANTEQSDPQRGSAANTEPSDSQRSSSRNRGGLDSQIEPLRQKLDIAVAEANQMNQEDLDMYISASERLTAASVDLEAQLRGNAAAEGISAADWQKDFAAYSVGVRTAKERLNGAIK